MNIHRTAQQIYLALANDSDAEAQIRTERRELALLLLTEPNKSFELTSSTVNGQSYSGTRAMTNSQRLLMLSLVVKMYGLEAVIPSKSEPIF